MPGTDHNISVGQLGAAQVLPVLLPKEELVVKEIFPHRYRIQGEVSQGVLEAFDLVAQRDVLIREVIFPPQSDREKWRERAGELAALQHPNFLNLLELLSIQNRDFVVTERPTGDAIADLRTTGVLFKAKEAIFLLSGLASAFDLAAQFTLAPNFVSADGLYLCEKAASDLKHLPVADWPPIRIKLDIYRLMKPTLFPVVFHDRHDGRPMAVRQTALLFCELLGGSKPKPGRIERWFKPIPTLNEAANSVLYGGLEWATVFESSENFLRSIELALDPRSNRKLAVPMASVSSSEGLSRRTRSSFWSRPVSVTAAVAVLVGLAIGLSLFFAPRRAHHRARDRKLLAALPAAPKPTLGKISIQANPPGTAFELEGPAGIKVKGISPAQVDRLAPGAYTVRLHAAGNPEYRENLFLGAGQSVGVDHLFSVISPQGAFSNTAIVQKPPIALPVVHDAKTSEPMENPAVAKNSPVIKNEVRSIPFPARARASIHREVRLTKAEVLHKVDRKWEPREQTVDRQIAALNRRLVTAKGDRKTKMIAYRGYLKKRKEYVHMMHRRELANSRREWNREHGYVSVFDSIFSTLGL